MMGDAVWIERARAGDTEAFGVLFRRYGIVGNAADADDLTQETFLRAYRALGSTTETLSLGAWLYRIATNACTDLLRRRRTARWLPWEEGFHERPAAGREEDPETALLDAEALRAFGAACGSLRP
jgi:RNA polymerase sigma-70 factor (ECF subfamily)